MRPIHTHRFRRRIKKAFQAELLDLKHIPRYNISPSQNIPVVVNQDNKILKPMRWGLIPFWAKDEKIGYKMINARVETIAEKPSFKRSLQRRRCLIPADGFYEWKRDRKTKIPLRVTLKSEEPFAFAGLWDTWKNLKGKELESCTIVT